MRRPFVRTSFKGVERAKEAVFDAYIRKPAGIEEIEEVLARAYTAEIPVPRAVVPHGQVPVESAPPSDQPVRAANVEPIRLFETAATTTGA